MLALLSVGAHHQWMAPFPLATFLLLLPLLGAVVVLCIPRHRTLLHRMLGLVIGLAQCVLGAWMWLGYESKAGLQWVDDWPNLLAGFGVRLGVDGVALPMVLLMPLLSMAALLVPSNEPSSCVKATVLRVLLLLTGAMGVLLSLNLYLLCVSWALVMLVIAGWAGAGSRSDAASAGPASLFVVLVGLTLFVAGVSLILNHLGTETASLQQLVALSHAGFPENGQTIFLLWTVAIALFSASIPFHQWLVEGQANVSIRGAMMLVGVVLPLGVAVYMRWGVALFPEALGIQQTVLLLLTGFAVLYGAIAAFMQTDPKRLLAYLTASQMGLIWMGVVLMRSASVEGAVIHTLQLGVTMGGLYCCVEWRESITQRIQTSPDGHRVAVPPVVRGFFLFFILAAIGLPGTGGFVGQLLILATTFQEALSSPLEHTGGVLSLLASWRIVVTIAASMATLGVLVGALALSKRLRPLVAERDAPHVVSSTDTGNGVRRWVVCGLSTIVLLLGLVPSVILEKVQPAVSTLVEDVGPRVIRARREHKNPQSTGTKSAVLLAPEDLQNSD